MRGIPDRTLMLTATAMTMAALAILPGCSLQDQFAFAPQPAPVSIPEGSKVQLVFIATRDEEQLAALYTPAAAGCPTFLNFHGNAQPLDGLGPVVEAYAARGVGFLAIAYRGYSGSTGHPTQKGIERDGAAGYAYLRANGVEAGDIVVRGFSIGSFVAINVAATETAGALVLVAPFDSGTRLALEQMRFVPVSLLAGNAFRSDRIAGDVEESTLIIHGDDDTVVPAQHSADLAERLPNLAARITIPGAGHNTLPREMVEAYVMEFLGPIYPDCKGLTEASETL